MEAIELPPSNEKKHKKHVTLDRLAIHRCHGDVRFKGAICKSKAKFIRISCNADPAKVYDLMINKWRLQPPQYFISVTGGRNDYIATPMFKQNFEAGLQKVVKKHTWVFTDGMNCGVTKAVGKSLRHSTQPCIGIASWGYISGKECLNPALRTITTRNDEEEEKEANVVHENEYVYQAGSWLESKQTFLDSNHTHFLLIDDGTLKAGCEFTFRSKLEEYILARQYGGIPTFGSILVVGGGQRTLRTVLKTAMSDSPLPIIFTKGSGRTADMFTYALNINFLKPELLKLISESYANTTVDERETIYDDIKYCMERRDIFTVCNMDSDSDLEEAVMKALLADRDLANFSQMQLAMLWNQFEFANDKILSKMNTWQGEDQELEWLMIMALALGRVDFVKLLLDRGVNIHSILTNEILQFLYGFRSFDNTSTMRYEYSERDYISAENSEQYRYIINFLCTNASVSSKYSAIPRNVIDAVIQKMCSTFVCVGDEKFTEELNLTVVEVTNDMLACTWQDYLQCTFKYPFRELFLWAVLNNMNEMALLLWQFEEEGIAKALIAAEIYKSLYENGQLYDISESILKSLLDNSRTFSDLAVELLNECYNTNNKKTCSLITSYLNQVPDMTCLRLAISSNHIDFVANDCIQHLLDRIWLGNMKNTDVTFSQVMLACSCPILVKHFDYPKRVGAQGLVEGGNGYFQVEEDDPDSRLNREIKTPPRKAIQNKSLCASLMHFYIRTPIVKFFEHLFAYIIFLLIFIYQALILRDTSDLEPSILEYFLIVTVFALLVGELHQVVLIDAPTMKTRFIDWVSRIWNVFDILAILLFFGAVASRWHSYTLTFSHILYTLDCALWILRLLNIFFIHPIYGPYVVMVGRMFKDMMHFMMLVFIFMIAYGVASTGLLYPKLTSLQTVLNSIFFPYFNIIGELFMDREPINNVTTHFGTPHFNPYTEPIAFVLLALFLLVANILLLNLLIAVFVDSFAQVMENSRKIWKFHRYSLVLEYSHRYFLPPPLSLIPHFFIFCKWLISLCGCFRGEKKDTDLQCTLSAREKEDLAHFENQCLTEVIRRREEASDVIPVEHAIVSLTQHIKGVKSTISMVEDRIKELDVSQGPNQYPAPSSLNRRSMGTLTSAIIESLMGCGANFNSVNGVYVTDSQLNILNQSEKEKNDLQNAISQKQMRIETLESQVESERRVRERIENESEMHFGLQNEGDAERESLKNIVAQKAMRIEELQIKNESMKKDIRELLKNQENKQGTNHEEIRQRLEDVENADRRVRFSMELLDNDDDHHHQPFEYSYEEHEVDREVKTLQLMLAEKESYIEELKCESEEKSKLYERHSVELNASLSLLEEKLREEREAYESMKGDSTEAELAAARLSLNSLEHELLWKRNSFSERDDPN